MNTQLNPMPGIEVHPFSVSPKRIISKCDTVWSLIGMNQLIFKTCVQAVCPIFLDDYPNMLKQCQWVFGNTSYIFSIFAKSNWTFRAQHERITSSVRVSVASFRQFKIAIVDIFIWRGVKRRMPGIRNSCLMRRKLFHQQTDESAWKLNPIF